MRPVSRTPLRRRCEEQTEGPQKKDSENPVLPQGEDDDPGNYEMVRKTSRIQDDCPPFMSSRKL